MATATVRLTLTVIYDLNGETVDTAVDMLGSLVQTATNRGLLSGNTDLEVNDFTSHVYVVNEGEAA
jgi:hypothetical protein